MTWNEFKAKAAKFVDEHEEDITHMGVYLLGATVASIMWSRAAKNNHEAWKNYARGLEICCGGMREGSNDKIFDIYLKNDQVKTFYRP